MSFIRFVLAAHTVTWATKDMEVPSSKYILEIFSNIEAKIECGLAFLKVGTISDSDGMLKTDQNE